MLAYKGTYWNVMMPILRKSLKRRFGKNELNELLQNAKAVYRQMLERVDDVGSSNPMSSNIYMCFVFLAVWKASDGKIGIEELRKITEEFVDNIDKGPTKVMGLFMDANKPGGIKSLGNMLHKNARWLEKHPEYKAASWDFNFDESLHKDGFYYHFTQCPLNNFARKEGMLDVLPVMCDIDHLTARLMHASLHREQTLAGGGSICDYWYVGDKIDNPQ